MTATDQSTQEVDDLLLERQLCFALTVASRSVVGVYKPVLERLGLTHPAVPGDAGPLGAEPPYIEGHQRQPPPRTSNTLPPAEAPGRSRAHYPRTCARATNAPSPSTDGKRRRPPRTGHRRPRRNPRAPSAQPGRSSRASPSHDGPDRRNPAEHLPLTDQPGNQADHPRAP